MTDWHDQDPLNGALGIVIWLPICIVLYGIVALVSAFGAWGFVALSAAWIARGVAGA